MALQNIDVIFIINKNKTNMKKSQLRKIIKEEIEKSRQLTIDFPENRFQSTGKNAKHIDSMIANIGDQKNIQDVISDVGELKFWTEEIKDADVETMDSEDYAYLLDDIYVEFSDATSPGWILNYLEKHIKPSDVVDMLYKVIDGVKTNYLPNHDID